MTNDNEEPQERVGQEETVLLSLLESATKSNPSARNAYQQRLQTFRPTTYFAKPASISPLVCARFGWTNPSQDLIVCQKCKAVVAIAFHPLLKAKAEVRIASLYKEKLCTAHKVTCPFHANAFPTSPSEESIPSFLGSVLPPKALQLFEQESNPKQLLEKQMNVLLESVGEERQPVPLDLSGTQMTQYLKEGESVEKFVSCIGAALGCGGEQNAWAAMLAVFCWEPLERQDTVQHFDPVVMLHCPVCLAQRGLPIQDDDDDESIISDSSCDDIRPAKKRRTTSRVGMNPMTSHRHYCPVICGFPDTADSSCVPMWQRIATKLLRAAERTDQDVVDEINGEQVLMNIHRLLQSGLQ